MTVRRRTGQQVGTLLKRTQNARLSLIAARNRTMAADDMRNLLLERLGLIERTGFAGPHPLRGQSVVEWTITDVGLSALAEARASKPSNEADCETP
jgi:hypothetical protein